MYPNTDEHILLSKRIDPHFGAPAFHQALRIAIYDEFRARAFYTLVNESFGARSPFSNIVQAEGVHSGALLNVMERYRVPPPVDLWRERLRIPESWMECCEIGVAGEIENIAMYDDLLPFVEQSDIRDVFYRLQAASHNNHLPAFRRCVEQKDAGGDGFGVFENILALMGSSEETEHFKKMMHTIRYGNAHQKGELAGFFLRQFTGKGSDA